MAQTAGDILVQTLIDWGVDTIFGIPGDGINGVFEALRQREDKIRFVQVRHEEAAAFAACAYAKFTGRLGVCLATSGPGAIHLLNGLYDAKLDHQPVVAIVGQSARAALGGSYQQEVDLTSLFKDVASEYVEMIVAPEQVRHVIDRALRIARAQRAPTCIIIPNDVQELQAEAPPRMHNTIHSGIGYAIARPIPHEHELQRAADALNAGRKVAMLVGAGALNATPEVLDVADVLGAGIAKALLGKAAVPDAYPFVTGSIGLLGTKPSYRMMMDCDTLLMVGSNFHYSEFLPREGQARGVQIDIDARMLSIRYPMEVNLVGDSATTLRLLRPLLKHKQDRSWRERIEKEMTDWWKTLEDRAMEEAHPINPQRVFWELSPRLPDRVILTCDSGSSANWYARDLRIREGMMASLSGGLATMGPGVPYAIAAKFAHPDRPVIAMVGDGAFQMNGMNEVLTIGKYWRRWSDPRLVILVLNNRDLNQVTWEQRVMDGDPKYAASQDIPDYPYARFAEDAGLRGIRVDRPEEVGRAWDEALASDRPVVLDIYTDPDVPPLPPHVTFKQARRFAESLVKGDPNTAGVIRASVKELFA